MPVYQIAKLNIKINPLYPETLKRLEPFLSRAKDFDFDATATEKEITDYIRENNYSFPPHLVEGSVILTKICRTVLSCYDGFFFHSSSLMLDGEAYVFTAASGTGKSTHTSLWRRHFGDRVVMINDDKPVIRCIDGRFWICSTPWMGKSEIGTNIDVPIRAVYVLQRGEKNSAVRVSTAKVFRQLLEATLVPGEAKNMSRLLELYDGLFSQVPLFLLSCNTEEEAAVTAYNAANKEQLK
ncbi:MAG: hypothetical protein UFA98_09945 [Ruminococcus sp.]|nr:hypothetical protein [Ruminococcus sp.]